MRTLVSTRGLQSRVKALAADIARDHPNGVHLVGVLKGAFVFLADLARELGVETTVDFMVVSSYGDRTSSSGRVRVVKDVEDDLQGRPVVVVEDVVDTGLTLMHIHERLMTRSPLSLRTACLLDKPSRRRVPVPIDYVGFTIEDVFVVGYGLDAGERHRHLPYLAVLDAGLSGDRDRVV